MNRRIEIIKKLCLLLVALLVLAVTVVLESSQTKPDLELLEDAALAYIILSEEPHYELGSFTGQPRLLVEQIMGVSGSGSMLLPVEGIGELLLKYGKPDLPSLNSWPPPRDRRIPIQYQLKIARGPSGRVHNGFLGLQDDWVINLSNGISYDSTIAKTLVLALASRVWQVEQEKPIEAFRLAWTRSQERKITVPILEISVSATNSLIWLLIISICILGLSVSNLQVLAGSNLKDIEEPWLLLDSDINLTHPHYVRFSQAIVQFSGRIYYISVSFVPTIVGFCALRELMGEGHMFISMIVGLASVMVLVFSGAATFHLLRIKRKMANKTD